MKVNKAIRETMSVLETHNLNETELLKYKIKLDNEINKIYYEKNLRCM